MTHCSEHFMLTSKKYQTFSPLARIWISVSILPDNKNTQLVQPIDGKRDEHEGKRVARRRDNCGKDKNSHKHMTLVAFQMAAPENPEFGQQPRDNGHLEQQTHHDRQNQQKGHVRAETNPVNHHIAHLIRA